MTEQGLQQRKDSVASCSTENTGHGSNNSNNINSKHGSKSHKSHKSHKSDKSHGSTGSGDKSEDTMRKYGKVVLRAPIKKGLREIPAERRLEDVGMYIQREVFDNAPVGHSTEDAEEQQKLKAFAQDLHDELLETKVRDAGYDRFAEQYNPHGDMMITAGFSRVRADEIRAANDTGTSLSKERFSSKYWGTWRTDVMILEKMSAEEGTLQKKAPTNYEILKKKKEKMARRVREETPSRLPGTSFSAGAAKGNDVIFFDSHMQGNRNTPSAIMKHSMLQPVPVSFHTPSALLPADP